MGFLNTAHRFGWATKLLHWLIVIGFSAEFYLSYRRDFMLDEDPFKLSYILWHKQLGFYLFFVALLMIGFRFLGTRPHFPDSMSKAHAITAKLGHGLLYVIMLAMPITGYLMSCYGGRSIMLLGKYTVPSLVGPNEAMGELLYGWHHGILPYVIMAVVGGHVLAALFHQFCMKDGLMKRML